MAGPTLVRDSEEWDACSADPQRLILGRTDCPAGKAGYKLRRSTTGHDKLNRGIQKAVLASGVHASWSDAETWAELHGLLTGVPNEVPDVDDRDAVSLFCVKVLMNRTLAPQEDVALPGATDGTTLKDVRARYSDVPSEAAFKDSITVRKAYLTRLLGYETVGSLAYGEPRMREIADAALVALVTRVNTEGAKSPATGQESSGGLRGNYLRLPIQPVLKGGYSAEKNG